MKPAPFEYFAPTSAEETRALLASYGDDSGREMREQRVKTPGIPGNPFGNLLIEKYTSRSSTL